jgi:hypothetical protein
MADKTMPTPGPHWVYDEYENGAAIHASREDGSQKETAFCENKGDAHLYAAAGTAAHDCAQMGYDPLEAVKALPAALEFAAEFKRRVEAGEVRSKRTYSAACDLLRAAGKEGADQ